MSTMANPEFIPPEVMADIEKCQSCEAGRRPRISLCTYHVGFWEGWEEAQVEVALLRSVVRAIDPVTAGPDGTWLEMHKPMAELTAEQAEAVKRAMGEGT